MSQLVSGPLALTRTSLGTLREISLAIRGVTCTAPPPSLTPKGACLGTTLCVIH